MKRYVTITIGAVCTSVLQASVATAVSGRDVHALLDHIDDLWRGESSRARVIMEVKTKRYERTLKMDAWSKGTEKTLIRITYPNKEKGSATLKSGHNIYSYFPKTNRTIRLSSGMMGGSWMGSHFTNDDLVKESRLRQDYDPKITFEGEREGDDIIEMALIPKEDAAVVWGKIVMLIDAKALLPVRVTYYDEDGERARTAFYSERKEMHGRTVPTIMRIVPTDKPNEHTRLIYEDLEFNQKLSDAFFSKAQLKRKR